MPVAFTPWSHTVARALLSGTTAALVSSLALAVAGRREAGSALAPINAVSHWFWGRRAQRQDGPSAKYTLLGFLTHHAASIFWALFFERLLGPRRAPISALASGTAIATLAAAVDYTITPKRLTPGYEARLSPPALVAVYAAFALGLALTGAARGMQR
jgi:hypothetical protein